ncbi:hypothetical protein RI367_005648 [Sorochytrium milnesiophthora]
MAKSIRSKSKRRFRAIKRATHFGDVANERLNKVCSRLHKGSKVVKAPHVEPEPECFSFKKIFVDDAIKKQADETAEAAADALPEDIVDAAPPAAADMDVDQPSAASLNRKKKKKTDASGKRHGKKLSKATGGILTRKGKDGRTIKRYVWR